MTNGEQVRAFEAAFAEYVGARFSIALCNGTATLHTALVALNVQPEEHVAVPPLTMSATTVAVLHARATPRFVDVDPDSLLMQGCVGYRVAIPVSLYGLHYRHANVDGLTIDDAAQTLRPHDPRASFTSYSFQASKILALGEGGMLVTNNPDHAAAAREFSSLGYKMRADQPRIDPATIKAPEYQRHHRMGWNYRMNDLTAAAGLKALKGADKLKKDRQSASALYADAIKDSPLLVPQRSTQGQPHDHWCYAAILKASNHWHPLVEAIEQHGGERPYAAWKVTYQEPAFRHLAQDETCPVAESMQPRILQFQTNDLKSAEQNAKALRLALEAFS